MKCALWCLLPAAFASALRAQGVSDASVDGRVLTDSAPLRGATVVLTNASTGVRTELTSRADGRFHIEDVPPGPYSIDVHAVGYAPAHRGPFRLGLGQRYVAELTLTTAPVPTLERVRVSAAPDIVRDADRIGAASTVSDSAVHHLPTLSRDFTELLQTVPGVVGNAIASVNNRYNSYLVDGALNTDFFGLSRGTGTPGGQEGARSLPLDAVDEFQVLLAPYDVRQGNFVAGQVNAITRSGTNEFHGSAFTFFQAQSLVGIDTAGHQAAHFSTYDYGLSVGGPIVRDHLHFFIAAAERQRSEPYSGPLLSATSPISADSAARFAQILRTKYNIDPGTFGPYTTGGVARNIFTKLSASTGGRGSLELSFNYAEGTTTDSIAPQRSATGDYRFLSAGFGDVGITRATRARWTQLIGANVSNEVQAGYLQADEPREPNSPLPAIIVSGVGATGARLFAGGDPSSQLLALRQRAEEVTDNLTIAIGPHTVTAGVRAQFLHFNFGSVATYVGQYTFASLTAFENGTPSSFTRNIALTPDGAVTDFGSNTYSVYAQDRWTLPHGLTVTGGLRLDVPTWPDKPRFNPTLATGPFAINSGAFIATNPMLSPRLGINWLIDRATAVRGGVGLFSGPMPYSWYFQAFNFNGAAQTNLSCKGAAAPVFVADPAAQPSACTGTGSPAKPIIAYFDRGFRQPEDFKASIGGDRALGPGLVGSLDVTYQYALHNLTIVDRNLKGPAGTLAGEGGRVQYGTIAATSAAGTFAATTPAYIDPAFGPVLENKNSSGDRSFEITPQVRKQFGHGLEFDVAYTYTNAQDRISNRDAQTLSNYGVPPISGTFDNRTLVPSTFDVPHQIVVTATANAPLGLAVSAIYIGRSGYDFTYVVNGDANADGIGDQVGAFSKQQNDPVYVPRNAADIALVRNGPNNTIVPAAATAYDSLNAFIDGDPCLRRYRGRLLPRNGCRNPWQNIMNVRLAERFPTIRGERLEVTLDVFNFLNLLDRDWGLVRETGNLSSSGTENVPMLTLRGTDATAGRNLYQLSLPARDVLNVDLSRWKLQLGVRYAF